MGFTGESQIVPTGALLGVLHKASTEGQSGLVDVRPVVDDQGLYDNEITFGFTYVAGRYKLTVERLPDDEE